ncbi:alpha/beta fold hydrolase [Amycolatopsis sp. NPDC026612]|uniref:alpha/beta hydrolase family protein n=1 Tax=Amycolatopsis sp. NPDC026612 TaxID=3155466 RepID=UPI0033FB12E1
MPETIREHRLDLHIDGDSLAMVLATPAAAELGSLAVLLHGGPGGQKDGPDRLYSDLARSLGEKGIASLRFDFRGVGESTGEYRDMTITRSVEEYDAVWRFARSIGFGHVGVIGESYGATIALRSEAADPDAVCLLWPAIYFLDVTFAPFVTEEKLETARRDGFTIEDGVEVGLSFLEEVLEIEDVEPGIRRLAAPTLLIHGKDDSEVPFRQSESAYALLSEPKKLVLVDGGDHCLARPAEREIVNAEVAAWFSKHL